MWSQVNWDKVKKGAGVLELCRGQFSRDTLGRCAHRAGSVPPPDVNLEIWATTQNLWGKASCPPFYTTQELGAVCLLAFSYNELVCCHNAQLSAGPLTLACPVPWQTFWGWRPAANTNHHLNRETDKWQREKEIAWYCSTASVYTRSARVLLDLLPKSLISIAEQNLLEGKEDIQAENMSITPTFNPAWEDLKLSVNAFSYEHQVVSCVWLREETWKLATIF